MTHCQALWVHALCFLSGESTSLAVHYLHPTSNHQYRSPGLLKKPLVLTHHTILPISSPLSTLVRMIFLKPPIWSCHMHTSFVLFHDSPLLSGWEIKAPQGHAKPYPCTAPASSLALSLASLSMLWLHGLSSSSSNMLCWSWPQGLYTRLSGF